MVEVARTSVDSRRRKRRSDWWIVGGVLAVLAAALAYAAWDVLTMPAEEVGSAVVLAKPQAAGEAKGATESPVVEAGAVELDLIDDDGETQWVSPTHGPPLDLAYLPPGVEIILALRPADLLAHPEGEKAIAALDPVGSHEIGHLEQSTGLSLSDIEQLVIGWQMQLHGRWETIQIVRPNADIPAAVIRRQVKDRLTYSEFDQTFVLTHGRAYFMRYSNTGPGFVDTTTKVFNDFFPHEPLRPRDLNRLLSHTDTTRHVTLIFQPQFLLGDRQNIFTGVIAPLKSQVDSFVGNDISAASLSMNWDDDFFVELIAVPTLDSSPEKMSDVLAGRVDEMPELVEEFVLGLEASPYSRRVVARLPEMVRRLAAYTRHGFDKDAAVLRCYLPVAAGHNFIMGAELALAEGAGAGNATARVGARPLAEASSPASVVEKLQVKTSLRFAREELEAALDMLAQDVGVKFVIRGPDLQLDGITRNQLFAIDLADRPAEEILVEILRRANPDKLATGPADPRQKLVYVVGPEAIFITTRARVAERGEELPAVFREE